MSRTHTVHFMCCACMFDTVYRVIRFLSSMASVPDINFTSRDQELRADPILSLSDFLEFTFVCTVQPITVTQVGEVTSTVLTQQYDRSILFS